MKTSKIILALFIVQIFCLFIPQTTFCQTETVSGTAKKSITISDLAGHWGFGNSLMLTYLDHGTGNYSHSGNIYGMKYSIKPDGTFYYKFAARVGNQTIREWGNGVVILSDGFIKFKFDQGSTEKYKLISLITGAKDEATLSLIQINESKQPLRCGHSKGYFDCIGSQKWSFRNPLSK